MPGIDRTGPNGQGPMTGRRMGRCNPSAIRRTDDELKSAIAGLLAVVIIGVTKKVWDWINEKRLKSELK